MSDTKYPEHEKLREVKDTSQAIGEFLEWLQSEGMGVAEYDAYANLAWVRHSTTGLLARYFGIDQKKLEQEKCAMLDEQRELNRKADR